MTGIGTDSPRDLEEFIRESRKRMVALERRQSTPYSLPGRLAADAPLLGTTDLNTVFESGWYLQSSNSNATTARNYPAPAGRAGELEVVGYVAGTDFAMQRYTDYQNNEVWRRTHFNGTWYAWKAETATPYSLPGRLEATTAITVVTDANNAVEAGWYKAVSAANTPLGTAAGHLSVFRANSNNLAIQQDFRRVYTTGTLPDIRVWSRVSIDNGATWTAWVQTAGDDTGWAAITTQNGWSGNNSPAYRVVDGVLYLEGEFYGGATGTVVFTLPAVARPVDRATVMIARYTTTGTPTFGSLSINTTGETWFGLASGTIPTSSPGYVLRGVTVPLTR